MKKLISLFIIWLLCSSLSFVFSQDKDQQQAKQNLGNITVDSVVITGSLINPDGTPFLPKSIITFVPDSVGHWMISWKNEEIGTPNAQTDQGYFRISFSKEILGQFKTTNFRLVGVIGERGSVYIFDSAFKIDTSSKLINLGQVIKN